MRKKILLIIAFFIIGLGAKAQVSVCAGSYVTDCSGLTASGVWTSSDAAVATIYGGNIYGVSAGSAILTFTPTTSCGVYLMNVTVNALPAITAGSPVTICSGLSTILTASGAGAGGSYAWSTGATTAATTVSPLTTTTYYVAGTDVNGCSSTSSVAVTVNALPSISAGSPVAICVGSSTMLTASGAGTGGSYAWSTGAATAATTVSPSTTTTYNVTGTDINGCSNTSSVTVTVNALPSISAGSPVAICIGSSTILTASGAGAGGSYAWSTGATTAATTVSPSATTTYNVTGTDVNGCSNTSSVAVTVNALPSISAGSPVTICSGSSTILTASGAGAGGSYLWSTGAATAATTVSPSTTTTYNVTGTDVSGCSNTSSVTVNVNALPSISAGSPVAICVGSSTMLTASGAGTGGSYAWSTGATTAATTVSPSTTTTYNVTGTDVNGCSNTSSVAVTVNALPSISAGSPVIICSGSSTILTASGAGAGGSYAWSTGAATAATTVSPSTTTTYNVTGTDVNGCSNTSSVIVTVNPLPDAGAISGPVSVCRGATIVLSESVSGGTWRASSRASITSTGIVTGVSTGTATISYSVTNSCGTAVATFAITVETVPPLPTVTGNYYVCPTYNTILTGSASTGGTWSTVDPATGTDHDGSHHTTLSSATSSSVNVHGNTTATIQIYYTVANMCGSTTTHIDFRVNNNTYFYVSSPVCVGDVFSPTPQYPPASYVPTYATFSVSNPAIATVSGSTFTALAAGTTDITYTFGTTDPSYCAGTYKRTLRVNNCGGAGKASHIAKNNQNDLKEMINEGQDIVSNIKKNAPALGNQFDTNDNNMDFNGEHATLLAGGHKLPMENFSIFPNPSDGNITIKQREVVNEMVSATIKSTSGVVVFSNSVHFDNGIGRINLKNTPEGVYFVEIADSSGNKHTSKIVIAK